MIAYYSGNLNNLSLFISFIKNKTVTFVESESKKKKKAKLSCTLFLLEINEAEKKSVARS